MCKCVLLALHLASCFAWFIGIPELCRKLRLPDRRQRRQQHQRKHQQPNNERHRLRQRRLRLCRRRLSRPYDRPTLVRCATKSTSTWGCWRVTSTTVYRKWPEINAPFDVFEIIWFTCISQSFPSCMNSQCSHCSIFFLLLNFHSYWHSGNIMYVLYCNGGAKNVVKP